MEIEPLGKLGTGWWIVAQRRVSWLRGPLKRLKSQDPCYVAANRITRAGSLPRAERLETVPSRTASADLPGGPRAPDQTGGAGGVRVGCSLVGCLRHRGDPAGAGCGGGVRPRQRTVFLRPADLPSHCRSTLAGNLQLSPDHPRLPLGRRGIHRGQGEPRHHRGADGRRGPAGGLRL
jgi:hypothetical protein